MKRFLSLFLAAVLVLSLAACGGTEVPPSPSPPESPASPSEAPEDVSASGPLEEPGSSPAPAPPVLTPAPGVEVRSLLTWKPGDTWVTVPFPVRGGRLLVEVHGREYSKSSVLGLDLEAEELEVSFPFMQGDDPWSNWDLRQVFDEEWAFKTFSSSGYKHAGWTQGGEDYSLPDFFLNEGTLVSLRDRKRYNGCWDWDAQPEKDLLTWTNPEGLWLAAADGSGARLVLTTGQIGQQPAFAQLVEDCKDLPAEMAVTFMSPRLMDGGRIIAVDFGSPGSQMLHWGLAVLEIASGNVLWYDPFVLTTGEELEYLDDTTLLAGMTKIDVTTEETENAWGWTLTERGPIYSGDFVHYFGGEKTAAGHELFACAMDNSQDAPAVLTATGYQRLFPFWNSAIDDRRVICEYEKPEEAGLLLVTAPET